MPLERIGYQFLFTKYKFKYFCVQFVPYGRLWYRSLRIHRHLYCERSTCSQGLFEIKLLLQLFVSHYCSKQEQVLR